MWRWVIFFSLLAAVRAGTVAGRVELVNSADAEVRRHRDYRGVVLWLVPADGPAPPARPRRIEVLQKDKRFIPHVSAVPSGSTVDFPNSDPVFHNAFSNFSGQPFDVGLYPPGTSRSVTFRQPGIVRVFCNIHSTMSAVIAVVPSPWYAVTDAAGRFSIASVPAGEYQVHIVHERALPENLRFLERRITVPEEGLTLPLISVSETGYIPAPHLNKYGHDYAPPPDDSAYPGARK